MDDKAIRKYVKERDAALLSLDAERIKRFLRKYGVAFPKNDVVFWAGVHKCICHMNAATLEQKLSSMQWLLEHGFSADIV